MEQLLKKPIHIFLTDNLLNTENSIYSLCFNEKGLYIFLKSSKVNFDHTFRKSYQPF
jgi:hypothetical protein